LRKNKEKQLHFKIEVLESIMSYKYQETKGNDSEINNIEGGGLNDQ
jgi:hypothetical protein